MFRRPVTAARLPCWPPFTPYFSPLNGVGPLLHISMRWPSLISCSGLCRRREWPGPLYETYRSRTGYTCLVLVNGREYQTDLAYESDHLARENAAMRAFMVCRNFSVNGGMLARNGIVQGLPASENRGRHKRRSGGGHRHSPTLSDSSSPGSSPSP